MIDVMSPEGATAPKGLSAIKEGMSQREVLQILAPLYEVKHSPDGEPSSPVADYFTYSEGGKTKFVEIFYDGNEVYAIRFGYTEMYSIE